MFSYRVSFCKRARLNPLETYFNGGYTALDGVRALE